MPHNLSGLLRVEDLKLGTAVDAMLLIGTFHTIGAGIQQAGFTVAYGSEPVFGNTFRDEVIHCRFCPFLRQLEIILIGALRIGVRA